MGKLKKGKHNHLLTDLLKFTIFSIVMLAPFLAVLSKCLYVSMNKNAYQSYSGNTELTYFEKKEYPTNDINNNGDLIVGNYYRLYLKNLVNDSTWADVSTSDIPDEFRVYGFFLPATFQTHNFGDFLIYDFNNSYVLGYADLPSNSLTLYSYNDNENYYFITIDYDENFDNGYIVLQYTLDISVSFDSTIEYQFFEPIQEGDIVFPEYVENTIEQSTLDNVFEYSVNQLSEMQLFNWTTNTAIYTPIEATTQGLGFNPQNNTLAILLTYWTLNTAIYIIFDIVIYCFTKLTHLTQE